jgi:hypothetical protein
VAVAR